MAFSDLIKKASGAWTNWRGGTGGFIGKDGDIVYSKNNVCVHPPLRSGGSKTRSHNTNKQTEDEQDTVVHQPGYLTVHCQHDDTIGATLILQWLPNATLESNPASIRRVSPRGYRTKSDERQQNDPRARIKLRHLQSNGANRDGNNRRESSSDSSGSVHDTAEETTTPASETDHENANSSTPTKDNDFSQRPNEPSISVEMAGDQLIVTSEGDHSNDDKNGSNGIQENRPTSLNTNGAALGVPSINVIPHTPMAAEELDSVDAGSRRIDDDDSPATSGADEQSDEQRSIDSSPCDSETESEIFKTAAAAETPLADMVPGETLSSLLHRYRELGAVFEASPEQFARSHNLMLPDGMRPEEHGAGENAIEGNGNQSQAAVSVGRVVQFHQKSPAASLFSVNLGHMRAIRVFFSDAPLCTSGQLVIASVDHQYKILHFHHGGLNKLAQIFDQWDACRPKSVKEGSPGPVDVDRHFGVCRPEVTKGELDPEDGLYEAVDWDYWRSSTNKDGSIEDYGTVKKAIFFASLEPGLRREAWPFLLRVYPWNSTREQRETIKNDLFLEYQKIKKRRIRETLKTGVEWWTNIENAVGKDVVRTDRRNPFFQGEGNENVEMMRNILLNYAALCPTVGYVQGMSDLLAPILWIMREETDSFWCFIGLMQRTIFVASTVSHHRGSTGRTTSISTPTDNTGQLLMDRNLLYLRELLKLLAPEFWTYICGLNGEATRLLFAHRWLLLFFKREFSENAALQMWESCWADHKTSHFHLFLCVAIINKYGGDAVYRQLPHDELLLYFASLANHMEADVVMKKARGLLYQFCRMESIPCTIAPLCQTSDVDQWNSHVQPVIECVQQLQVHGNNDPCPYAS